LTRSKPTYEELEARLARAEEALNALKRGEVDALIGESHPWLVRARQVEEALESTRRTLDAVVETVPALLVMTDPQGNIVMFNRACEELTGYDRREVIGKNLFSLFLRPEWIPVVQARFADPFDPALREPHENPWVTKSGQERMLEWRCSVLPSPCGSEYFVLGAGLDVTERKRAEQDRRKLEARLRQAEKMEAIGRLAGGVAHDFNNMLSVICGYGEMARSKLSPHDPLFRDLEQILRAADRSADLTRQLLAFSRKQIIEPRLLDLNRLVEESQKMLRRLVGEEIEFRFVPGEGLWPVRMDPVQVDQILANLAANARDAIRGSGAILIETSNARVSEEDALRIHPEMRPGDYVRIMFRDTGSGMEPETVEKIFEPFFSTKGEAGTGLGLSTVYGIVRQNEGFITVQSAPGAGTVFEIYLPRQSGAPESLPRRPAGAVALPGGKTVLVVEDEEQILRLCKAFLERQGYTVLTADRPGEALLLCERHAGTIDLLVADVVLPTMSGVELREKIEKVRPGIRTLYMSGYSAEILAPKGIVPEGTHFIRKPFALADFAAKIREVMGSP